MHSMKNLILILRFAFIKVFDFFKIILKWALGDNKGHLYLKIEEMHNYMCLIYCPYLWKIMVDYVIMNITSEREIYWLDCDWFSTQDARAVPRHRDGTVCCILPRCLAARAWPRIRSFTGGAEGHTEQTGNDINSLLSWWRVLQNHH